VSNCNFPLRTSDVHRGRTYLSLTHICCEDPKRIKVGTSAKCVGGTSNLAFPCDHKLDRLQELRLIVTKALKSLSGKALSQSLSDRHLRPSPKSAILRILGVDRRTFPYSFDDRCIVPAELVDPGLSLLALSQSRYTLPFRPQHLLSITRYWVPPACFPAV
jgi:hypothetical protein